MQGFQNIDVEKLADQMFNALNSIDVRDLWDRSGETYYGYEEPSEVTGAMVEEAIDPFVRKLKDYRKFDMRREEEMCCQALCVGLLRHESEGTNEFHGWVPDDPRVIADNLYYDWRKSNQKEEWTVLYKEEVSDL